MKKLFLALFVLLALGLGSGSGSAPSQAPERTLAVVAPETPTEAELDFGLCCGRPPECPPWCG